MNISKRIQKLTRNSAFEFFNSENLLKADHLNIKKKKKRSHKKIIYLCKNKQDR